MYHEKVPAGIYVHYFIPCHIMPSIADITTLKENTRKGTTCVTAEQHNIKTAKVQWLKIYTHFSDAKTVSFPVYVLS